MVKFSPGEMSDDGCSPKRQKTAESEGSSPAPKFKEEHSENSPHSSFETRTIHAFIDPDVLDCSICMERLSSPVFQCSNGHIACSSCCVRMKNRCHSCYKGIGQIRCLAIEKLIESVKVLCKFAPNGCKQLIRYSEIALHEESCIHMPYACPVSGCTFQGPWKDFPNHFSCGHGAPIIKFKTEAWFSVMLKTNEQYCILEGEDIVFLLQNQITAHGNHVFAIGIGPSSLQEHYTYQIEIKKGRRRLTMESIPHVVGCFYGDVKDYLVIPLEAYEEDGHFLFEISFHHRI